MIRSIHAEFADSEYGLKNERRLLGGVHVHDVRQVSKRLLFLTVCDDAAHRDDRDDATHRVADGSSTPAATPATAPAVLALAAAFPSDIQLLVKSRDGFVDEPLLATLAALLRERALPTLELDALCFVERDATLGNADQEQQQHQQRPAVLHAMTIALFERGARNVDANAAPLLRICKEPLPPLPLGRKEAAPFAKTAKASATTISTSTSSTPSRVGRVSGSAKRNRAPKFAQFVTSLLGVDALRTGGGVLDVAGGAGALSFEFAVRRGVSTVG